MTDELLQQCSCGRDMNRHCPDCGSGNYYALKHYDIVSVTNPETGITAQERARTFRCRKCGVVFNDVEWRNKCRAPQVKLAQTASHKRRTEIVSDALETIGTDRMGTLQRLFNGVKSSEK